MVLKSVGGLFVRLVIREAQQLTNQPDTVSSAQGPTQTAGTAEGNISVLFLQTNSLTPVQSIINSCWIVVTACFSFELLESDSLIYPPVRQFFPVLA